ncbi:MAG: hypothetical protein M1832_000790 [Thelocarpon impressellum]|nr:MAG: hypothetical protein M1832_000790 [Thelocarpon impressellum]
MDNAAAVDYIKGLLGQQLRVTTADTRIFVGQMKCTDKDRNIILACTQEYRHPPPSAVALATAAAAAAAADPSGAPVRVDMSSRFMGLVVVPGEYITKIEVEGPPERPRRPTPEREGGDGRDGRGPSGGGVEATGADTYLA